MVFRRACISCVLLLHVLFAASAVKIPRCRSIEESDLCILEFG